MATTVKTPYDIQLANARSSLLTPAQLRNVAASQAGSQINTQLGANYASSDAEQAGYLNLANRAAGLAAALGSAGPEQGQASFDVYNNAAKTIGSLGTGLVGAVSQDWQAEQAANQATIAKTLGPGLGKVDSYDPAALRSALQYTGVTMPGSGLANQALTARSLAQYGAQADKAQVALVSKDYISQAKQALDQRAAERTAIVAKRPELFQTALQAQREDNAQTQAHIDSLITASQTWLANKDKTKTAKEAAAHNWWLQQVAATHIDPITKQPVGGWTWADKGHTVVVPYQTKASLAQSKTRLGQGQQQLDLTEQHYADMKTHYDQMYNAAQKANDLKQQLADKPGKFDKNMSAAVGYISDAYGHPYLAADGKPVPYKTPGKAPKPMSTTDKLKIQGSMATYADTLKNGATDPKTGAELQKAVDIQTAVGMFAARGYLTGKLAPWGLTALAQSYSLTPDQLRLVIKGYDPATGSRYGYVADQPPVPEGYGEGKADPRYQVGRPWNPDGDKAIGLFGTTAQTKSGHFVDMKTRKYIR